MLDLRASRNSVNAFLASSSFVGRRGISGWLANMSGWLIGRNWFGMWSLKESNLQRTRLRSHRIAERSLG